MELVKKSEQKNIFTVIKGDWNNGDELTKIEFFDDEDELKDSLYFYVFLTDFYNHFKEIERLDNLDIRTDIEDAVQVYLEQIKHVNVLDDQIRNIEGWIYDAIPVEESTGYAIWNIIDMTFHVNGTQFELNFDETEIDDCIKTLLKNSK